MFEKRSILKNKNYKLKKQKKKNTLFYTEEAMRIKHKPFDGAIALVGSGQFLDVRFNVVANQLGEKNAKSVIFGDRTA